MSPYIPYAKANAQVFLHICAVFRPLKKCAILSFQTDHDLDAYQKVFGISVIVRVH